MLTVVLVLVSISTLVSAASMWVNANTLRWLATDDETEEEW